MKLGYLVGIIIKKFVTMQGHMDVKSMSKLREVVGRYQNKYLFSRKYISEIRPCSATDRQIGSDRGWK